MATSSRAGLDQLQALRAQVDGLVTDRTATLINRTAAEGSAILDQVLRYAPAVMTLIEKFGARASRAGDQVVRSVPSFETMSERVHDAVPTRFYDAIPAMFRPAPSFLRRAAPYALGAVVLVVAAGAYRAGRRRA